MVVSVAQPSLFSPITLGGGLVTARSRVWMAPLTRCRGGTGDTPTDLTALYYAQRADPRTGAGLIISEASPISPEAHGYPRTPGIHTDAQQEGWARVASAVRARGGVFVHQLWHVGPVSHPDYQPGGALPVAPSALNPGGMCRTLSGHKPRVTPRALDTAEIPRVVSDYVRAARRSIDAGTDGVQIHAANTYLIERFLRSESNRRTDRYGGPIENRCRFCLEVVDAVIAEVGAGRVSIRLSPSGQNEGVRDEQAREVYTHLVRELDKRPLQFVEIREADTDDTPAASPPGLQPIPIGFFRPLTRHVLCVNTGYTFERASAVLARGEADAVTFGVPFIANPDLAARFRRIAQGERVELATSDPKTWYPPMGAASEDFARGYTDYPTL
ncbi:MAG: alkene reductase [Planctomycetota bacterium]|nr:alkene reductase [Planctomycetota bacterium]